MKNHYLFFRIIVPFPGTYHLSWNNFSKLTRKIYDIVQTYILFNGLQMQILVKTMKLKFVMKFELQI